VDVPFSTSLEEMEWFYQRHCKELRAALLEKVQSASPEFFEHLVVELVRLGYGAPMLRAGKAAGRVTGKVGDEGIDGVIQLDRLGLEHLYIQAKRWRNGVVSRSDIQQFVGALHGTNGDRYAGGQARRGVFITTAAFTKSAREYAAHIADTAVLIDGAELAELMLETGLGLVKVRTYEVFGVSTEY